MEVVFKLYPNIEDKVRKSGVHGSSASSSESLLDPGWHQPVQLPPDYTSGAGCCPPGPRSAQTWPRTPPGAAGSLVPAHPPCPGAPDPLCHRACPCPLQIEYISGGSPLTNQHYIASPRGEIYGIDHGTARMQAEAIATMRPQTAVPNLYLTGTTAPSLGEDVPRELGWEDRNLQFPQWHEGMSHLCAVGCCKSCWHAPKRIAATWPQGQEERAGCSPALGHGLPARCWFVTAG